MGSQGYVKILGVFLTICFCYVQCMTFDDIIDASLKNQDEFKTLLAELTENVKEETIELENWSKRMAVLDAQILELRESKAEGM